MEVVMAVEWGVFLCDCSGKFSVELEQLARSTPHAQFANHTDASLSAFVDQVRQASCRRVLISCNRPQFQFEDAFATLGAQSPQLHFLDLHHDCFQVHDDTALAQDRASRLLQAAMRGAEVRLEPAYQTLAAEGRILIVGGGELGRRLSRQLRDVAQPIGVLPSPSDQGHPDAFSRVYHGQVRTITGRLGDFQVEIETSESGEAVRELVADQVVTFDAEVVPPVKARTGYYALIDPSSDELDEVANRIRGLIGRFWKEVHVGYQADICAGGAANHEACGRCIPACPYEAIQRDPSRPLRIQVDHMSCEGCGACVAACPTSALRYTEPSPRELQTRLAALLEGQETERSVILFHCGEQGRRTLTAAGEMGWSYSAAVLPVEVPCLRYVSAANMMTAFRFGAAGVGLLGCSACPHGERELLYQNMDVSRVTLDAFGLGGERLALITVAEGEAEGAVTDMAQFADQLDPTPIQWDGRVPRETASREAFASAVAGLIEATGREPGRAACDASYPFAVTSVRESGCTMCRSCVNVCPTHAFRFDEADASLKLKQMSCIACGLCETVCPEHVIDLEPSLELSRRSLDYHTIVQDAQVGCARCGKPFINQKALEAIETKLFGLAVLGDAFDGPRRSLLRMCPDCRAVAAMMEVEQGWEP